MSELASIKLTTYASVVVIYDKYDYDASQQFQFSNVRYTNTRSNGTTKKLHVTVYVYVSQSWYPVSGSADSGYVANNAAIGTGVKSKGIGNGVVVINVRKINITWTFAVGINASQTRDEDGQIWSGTGSGSWTIPTAKTYAIKFDLNGGYGSGWNDLTKYHDMTLNIYTGHPARSGYAFDQWRYQYKDTGTRINEGGQITANANATLYAAWIMQVTIDVKSIYRCDANNNRTPFGQYIYVKYNYTKPHDKTIWCYAYAGSYSSSVERTETTANNGAYSYTGASQRIGTTSAPLTRFNHYDVYAQVQVYIAGASVSERPTATSPTYTQHNVTYNPPTITNLKVVRCDEKGNEISSGTYAKVTFSYTYPSASQYCLIDGTWQTDTTNAAISSITYNMTVGTQTSSGTFTSSSDKTKTVIIGTFAADQRFPVKVTLQDGYRVDTRTDYLATSYFLMDFLAGGLGISVGAAAIRDNYFNTSLAPIAEWKYPMLVLGSDLTPGYLVPPYSVETTQWAIGVVDSVECYRSVSNWHVDGAMARAIVWFNVAGTYTVYYRSYAESNYDYVVLTNQNTKFEPTSWTAGSAYTDTNVAASTRGAQSTTFSSKTYTINDYQIQDGMNYIEIVYGKDGSQHSNDDRGYFYIVKTS